MDESPEQHLEDLELTSRYLDLLMRNLWPAISYLRKSVGDRKLFVDSSITVWIGKHLPLIMEENKRLKRIIPNSPIFRHSKDDLWYYWIETWADFNGPFLTRKEAENDLAKYIIREELEV